MSSWKSPQATQSALSRQKKTELCNSKEMIGGQFAFIRSQSCPTKPSVSAALNTLDAQIGPLAPFVHPAYECGELLQRRCVL
jgi:hypothetical protein